MKFDNKDLRIDVNDVVKYMKIDSQEEAYGILEFFRSKVSKSVLPNDREYLIDYMIRSENDTIYFR